MRPADFALAWWRICTIIVAFVVSCVGVVLMSGAVACRVIPWTVVDRGKHGFYVSAY